MNKLIQLEIAYALPCVQHVITITIAVGSTIEQAIQSSGMLKRCPEINLNQQKVGIFGRLHQLCDQVKEGDRIEIYRPLSMDPKEKRRIKAKKI